MRSVHRTPPLGRKIHCPLPTIALSPLAATLTDPPRKCCKQKTYGLANPFRCNTYKKQGVPSFKPKALSLFVSPFLRSLPPYLLTSLPPYFLTSLLHYFQKRLRPFRSDEGLLRKGRSVFRREDRES